MSIAALVPVTNRDNPSDFKRAIASVIAQIYPPNALYVYYSEASAGEIDRYLTLLCAQSSMLGLPVHVFRETKLSSAAIARNVLIEAASETHLAFLDSDDEWHEKHLADFSQLVPTETNCLYFTDYLMRQSANQMRFGPFRRDIYDLLRLPILMSSTIVTKSDQRFWDMRGEDFAFTLGYLLDAETVVHNPEIRVTYDLKRRKRKSVWFRIHRTFNLLNAIVHNSAKATLLTALATFYFVQLQIFRPSKVKQVTMIPMQKYQPE